MMEQNMNDYTAQDLLVWKQLFERQQKNLLFKGSKAYLRCLDEMKSVLNGDDIPDFSRINEWFKQSTAWSIEVVPGLIEVDRFFELLAEKRFCSSTWLRTPENLDYLEEPDMFHDVFGHIPLLADPVFSEFAHEFGKLGVQFSGNEQARIALQRLYWFTIEFGVISEENRTKVYGAGIISSFGETNRVADGNCNIHKFDIEEILERSFRTDMMQNDYFLIKSLEELFECLPFVKTELKRYGLDRKKQQVGKGIYTG